MTNYRGRRLAHITRECVSSSFNDLDQRETGGNLGMSRFPHTITRLWLDSAPLY